jgi:hypothetical protein
VKPGLPYLDIIRLLRDHSALPIAAYQVSSEIFPLVGQNVHVPCLKRKYGANTANAIGVSNRLSSSIGTVLHIKILSFQLLDT